jgi:glucose/arabinose dehydrogenase
MMKKLSLMVGALGVLAFLMAAPAGAQQQSPPAAPAQSPQAAPATTAPAAPAKPATGKHSRMYDPQAVETVTGTVVSVDRRAPRKLGRPERVSMVVKTDKGDLKVNLGPTDYLDQQALKLKVGDQIEVKGMRVKSRNRTMLIAGEVKKGGQVLKLRDDATGRPLWAKGQKRRSK